MGIRVAARSETCGAGVAGRGARAACGGAFLRVADRLMLVWGGVF
jgi:hypothetical protein